MYAPPYFPSLCFVKRWNSFIDKDNNPLFLPIGGERGYGGEFVMEKTKIYLILGIQATNLNKG